MKFWVASCQPQFYELISPNWYVVHWELKMLSNVDRRGNGIVNIEQIADPPPHLQKFFIKVYFIMLISSLSEVLIQPKHHSISADAVKVCHFNKNTSAGIHE